jgi:hypothetical protein
LKAVKSGLDDEVEGKVGSSLLPSLPDELSKSLIRHLSAARQRLLFGDNLACEIEAAKFCEAVIRVIEWATDGGKYTALGTPLHGVNPAWVSRMEGKVGDETLCFHIPKIVNFVLGVRNKRGAGHLPGTIDTNALDAMVMERSITWIMAELIRLYHQVPFEVAQAAVNRITEHHIPVIWAGGGSRKVLRTDLSYKEKVLVLLFFSESKAASLDQLFAECEHDRKRDFKSKIILPLHKDAFVHFNESSNSVHLTPLGIKRIETGKLYEMPA